MKSKNTIKYSIFTINYEYINVKAEKDLDKTYQLSLSYTFSFKKVIIQKNKKTKNYPIPLL